jgi:hypothetical protein
MPKDVAVKSDLQETDLSADYIRQLESMLKQAADLPNGATFQKLSSDNEDGTTTVNYFASFTLPTPANL